MTSFHEIKAVVRHAGVHSTVMSNMPPQIWGWNSILLLSWTWRQVCQFMHGL